MLLDIFNIYLFISVCVTTFYSAYLLSKSKASHIKLLLILSVVINIYLYGYSAEIHSQTLDQMLFWNYFQYLGIPFVSALWLTICLMYAQKFFFLRWWLLALIYAIPVLTFVLRMTNDFHHLYFGQMSIETVNGHLLLVKERGVWMYVQAVHSAGMVVASMVLYIKSLKKKPGRTVYMLVAAFIVVVGLALNLFQPFTIKMDYMVMVLPITVMVVVAAIIRNDFLEVKALAREIIFDQNADAMLLLDNNMFIIDYNEAAKEFFRGQNIKLRKASLKRVTDDQQTLFAAIQSPQTTWVQKSKDAKRFFEISTTYIKGNGDSVYGELKTIHDITDFQLLTSNLKIQATIDELSGVLNRRAFIDKCHKRLNSSSDKEFALFMVDVDNFKQINDTLGHMTGDRVIKELGAMLGRIFRKSDVIGRLGGDEFAIFISIDGPQTAKDKAEKLTMLVRELSVDEADWTLRVSIGVAVTQDGHRTMDILMKHADIALYASKAGGRNKATLYGT